MIEFISFLILGLISGTFISIFTYRIPQGISLLSFAKSICPKCNEPITWQHNIPIFSFFLLKGKCSNCKLPISKTYPIIESLTIFITLVLFFKFEQSDKIYYILSFFYLLILLSFIDFEHKAVPDYLLLAIFILSFLVTNKPLIPAIKDAILFSGAFVLLNFLITFYIQNIKSRIVKDETLKYQEALGEGDIPIIASIGVILGVELGVIAIFLSALFAIIPAIYNNFLKNNIEIPFIPYLSLGLLSTIVFEKFFTNIIGLNIG